VNETKELLRPGVEGFEPMPDAFERVLARRDRKRRNKRITAGILGITVFVAAVWIVRDVTSLDRTRTVVPGGSGTTGPAETGSTFTPPRTGGHVEPGESTGPTGPTGWDGYGIPPKGTALSTPVEGQPILQQDYEGEYLLGKLIKRCHGGCGKWYHTHLAVYADGRVLWWNDLRGSAGPAGIGADYVKERRLTPEGVDLVRSGIDPDDLPDSAWADAEARPYAPPRYSVCFVISRPDGEEVPSATDVVRAMDLLPAAANALLRGTDPDPLHPGCVVVSTQEARAFTGILSEEGLETGVDGVAAEGFLGVTPGSWVDGWLLRGAERVLGEPLGVNLRPLWPDGDWHQLCCA
jgi:hypothetical protein